MFHHKITLRSLTVLKTLFLCVNELNRILTVNSVFIYQFLKMLFHSLISECGLVSQMFYVWYYITINFSFDGCFLYYLLILIYLLSEKLFDATAVI